MATATRATASIASSARARARARRTTTTTRARDDDADAGLRAAWHGAEALGNLIGATRATTTRATTAATATAMTRASALEAIRADYAEEYFVSGRGAMAAYARDCEFADPFASFRGLDRFRANVANLGGMMREVDLRIESFEETEDGVQTEWRFSCVLDLPWRPMLAASGGTTHVLNDENRVVRHYERWDVDPRKVLGQLLRPASKIPENQAEVFMASAGSGDVVGAAGAAAPALLRVSAPLWLASAALRAGTHTESTGIEGFFGWLFALACVSQVAKFLRGIGIS